MFNLFILLCVYFASNIAVHISRCSICYFKYLPFLYLMLWTYGIWWSCVNFLSVTVNFCDSTGSFSFGCFPYNGHDFQCLCIFLPSLIRRRGCDFCFVGHWGLLIPYKRFCASFLEWVKLVGIILPLQVLLCDLLGESEFMLSRARYFHRWGKTFLSNDFSDLAGGNGSRHGS